MTQLWVGCANIWGTEEQLISHIRVKCGIVAKSAWFCRNRGTGELAGYGFVDFVKIDDAVLVMRMLKDTPIPHSPSHLIRLNWGNERAGSDAEAMQKATGFKCYVGNLASTVTHDKLLSYFQGYFPDAIAANIVHGPDGFSRGFGFVKFHTFQEVKDAIKQLNGSTELGRAIKVGEAATNRMQGQEGTEPQSRTLLLRDVDTEIVTMDKLKDNFSPYGNVVRVTTVDEHPDWAYVVMETQMEAESARNALQGSRFGGTTKCDIQFGRDVDDSVGKPRKINVLEIAEERKKVIQPSEFFCDKGLRSVIDKIQRVAEVRRVFPLVTSDAKIANRIASQIHLQGQTRAFDWCFSEERDSSPRDECVWFF